MTRIHSYKYECMVEDAYVKLVYTAEELKEYLIEHRNDSVIILTQVGDLTHEDKVSVYVDYNLDYANSIILDIHNIQLSIMDNIAIAAYKLWICLLQSISMENKFNKGISITNEERSLCTDIKNYLLDADNVKYFDDYIINCIQQIIDTLI